MKHAAKKNRSRHLSRTAVTVAGAFLLSFVLFGLVLLLPGVIAKLKPDDEPEQVAGARGVQRQTWLLFHEGKRLTGLVRFTTDTRTMTVTAVGYPPQTEVIDGVEVTTAAAVYARDGERAAALIDPLPVLSFSVDGAAALMGQVAGNLPLTLAQTVGDLPAGRLTLTPLQAAEVLRFEGYEQGGVEAARVHTALVAAFCNRALTAAANFESAFRALSATCDTRLNISQFEAVRDDLAALGAANTGSLCTARVVSGTLTGNPPRYVAE